MWLDVDTGHDDAFAILLAAHHPKVRLLGISTVYGNASLEHTTYNTRAILTAIGQKDVPVYAGARKPFCRPAAHAPDIHGESGLDGTSCLPVPNVPARTEVTAIEAAYKALTSVPKGTAWLVATGALTNIALLFALHPDLAEYIAGLSIMGGAVGGGFTEAPMGTVSGEGERFGNHTPWAEFNIYCDPESAASLFSNPKLAAKTTLVTLDLTHQFLANQNIRDMILHGREQIATTDPGQAESPVVRRLFHEIVTFFAKTYADVFGLVDGPPTHDPLAVAAAFVPHLFGDNGGERFDVSVVTDGDHGASDHARTGGSQCGRTKVQLLPRGHSGVRVPRSVQSDTVWRLIGDSLRYAEKASNNP